MNAWTSTSERFRWFKPSRLRFGLSSRSYRAVKWSFVVESIWPSGCQRSFQRLRRSLIRQGTLQPCLTGRGFIGIPLSEVRRYTSLRQPTQTMVNLHSLGSIFTSHQRLEGASDLRQILSVAVLCHTKCARPGLSTSRSIGRKTQTWLNDFLFSRSPARFNLRDSNWLASVQCHSVNTNWHRA